MTFADILADVYRRSRYQASPASDVVTRIKAFINETQQELAEDPRLASLLRGTTTFTTTASRAEYGLPPEVERVVTIRDTTNRWPLTRESLSWYRAVLPNQTTQTGTPISYADLGPKPVLTQPSTATGLWVVGGAGAAETASIEVERSGGYPYQTSAILNGVTRVQLGTLTDYTEVIDWYLSAASATDVSLYDASTSGNLLGVIPRGQTRSTSQWIGLAPTPSAALTYTIDYERSVTDLVNDTDAPLWLPVAFHRLLAIGARRRESEFQDNADRVAIASSDWDAALTKLVAVVNNPPGYVVIPGGRRVGRSDLGPNYPVGTIWN